VLCFLGYQAKAQMYFIPDLNFRAYLQTNYASCMNTTGDSLNGSCSAVLNTSSLNVSNHNISNLKGIQAFQNLQTLNCEQNQLTNIPSLPSTLKNLNCGQNQLISISALPSTLKYFYCDDNQLSNLPALPISLFNLICSNNQLTNLPTLPPNLYELRCDTNQLTNLPTLPSAMISLHCYSNFLTSLPTLPFNLNSLYCGYNQLTNLPALPSSLTTLVCHVNSFTNLPTLPYNLDYFDCSSCNISNLPSLPPSLTTLICGYNLLTSLPSLPSSLKHLTCTQNQLTSLPSLSDSLKSLYCGNNFNLNCLPDLKNVQTLYILNTGIQCLPNYGKVTNCNPPLSTFPICGIYNTNSCEVAWNINGNVYLDSDSNCVKAIADSGISNQKIELFQNGSLVQQTYSNLDGNYYFDTDSLTIYSTSIDTSGLPFSIICPLNATYTDTLTTIDSLKSNRDFAAKCKGVDLAVTSIYGLAFRPAWISDVKIHAGDFSNNFGAHCATGISGTVQVNITGACQYYAPAFGALTPTSVIGNSLTYNIADFGTIDYLTAFGIQILVDTTAVLGSQICVDVVVQTLANDINHSNDTLTHCFTIVGSYDPNDKLVYPTNLDL